jgi:pilus assembly protein CpaE
MPLGLSDNIAALLSATAPPDASADPALNPQQPLSAAVLATGLPLADSIGVAIIGPDPQYQAQIVRPLALSLFVVRQIQYYPPLDQVPLIARIGLSIYIVDLDSDPAVALKLVESLSRIPNSVVLVASGHFSTDLVVGAMRAGAREVLPLPLTRDQLDDVMARARSRLSAPPDHELGRLCVFLGAKGGAGTTTVASNFAMAAALGSEKRTLLIDFDLPLGDAVLNFGMEPQFSTRDALSNCLRLDANLLSSFVARHDSGLFILPAQGRCDRYEITREAVDKLILVARQMFDCVVLDAGTRFDLADTAIFHPDAQIYIVSQVSIADLRNSNRILSQLASSGNPRNVQVVLNRDAPNAFFDDEVVAKVLTRPVRWRVPNDFRAVREMQNTGIPVVMKDRPMTHAIRSMASAALDLSAEPEPKKRRLLGLF